VTPKEADKQLFEWGSDAGYCYDHIYYIKDKNGDKVLFKPNSVQKTLIDNRHRRNVVPKARQHGITTCVAIHFLNMVLHAPYQTAAIIAHRESDALKIFDTKIKFVYDNIPEYFKEIMPKPVRCNTNTIVFDNGSSITADTMVRSTTLNYLHVSELGKMAAWYPLKAEEVRVGAFPAAERGEIFVESTMEGNSGLMAELCETARNLKLAGADLTEKDYKFFFFGWHENSEYRMSTLVEQTEAEAEYFRDLIKEGVILDKEQCNWYLKEKSILGEKIKQEYPSTFEESIAASVEGAYFAHELNLMRQERRLCNVPHDNHAQVYASFDIGINDATAIVLFQLVGKEIHIIDHYEASGEDIAHYMSYLSALPYAVYKVFLPHDAGARSLQTGRTLEGIVHEDFGFKTHVLKRDQHEILGIDLAKNYFNRCWFDKRKTGRLIECLTLFSKEYNRRFGTWQSKSRHDQYSDSAKSFIYAMQGVDQLERHSIDSDFAPGELAAMRFKPTFRR
jgi:hypothetical protein